MAAKKTSHSKGKTFIQICKQKILMKSEDDPYDILPESVGQRSARLRFPAAGHSSTEASSSSGVYSQSDSQATSAIKGAESMCVPASQPLQAGAVPLEGNNAQTKPEEQNMQARNVLQQVAAEERAPALPRRRSTATENRRAWNRVAGSLTASGTEAQVDHSYLHVPYTLPKGYINVNPSFKHLEGKKVLIYDNEYSGCPVACGMNAPMADDDRVPTAHTSQFNRNGYLTHHYITKSICILEQPPEILQNFLNDLYKSREFGVINVNADGGHFPVFSTETNRVTADALLVFVPEYCFKEETILFFIRSENYEDFPPSVPRHFLCSDVIHMLPHRREFPEPILVRIPLYEATRNMDHSNLSLMYSESDSGEKNPVWKLLHKTPDLSCPVWFFKDGYLYLYVKHFCMFVVVDNRSCVAKTYKPLKASLSLEYKPQTKGIVVALRFDTQTAEKEQTPEIETEEESFMLCMNNENVEVELEADDHWRLVGRRQKVQEVSYIQLSQIESLTTKPRIKYCLQCKNSSGCSECEGDRGVLVSLKLYQHNGDIAIDIEQMTSLSAITRSSRPAVVGSCNTAHAQDPPSPGLHSFDSDAAPFKLAVPYVRIDAQEHSEPAESLSAAAIRYIRERYLSLPYDAKTGSGILTPDTHTENNIARILDPGKGWEMLAREFSIPITGLCDAESPSKLLLRTYAMQGRMCNWNEFSERLRLYGYHMAADALCDWYSEQTVPKEKH